MKLRLLKSIGQLSFKSADGARASTIPRVKSTGGLRMRHFELADYSIIDVEADVDIIWTPGVSKARLKIRESLLRYLKVEQLENTLKISSASDFDGDRPVFDLSGQQLSEIHLGASCSASVYDLHASVLIASAFERSSLRAQGHVRELHIECQQSASVDCASLICELAVADLSGGSIALLRAEAALQADTRDSCHLLTIGSPRILDVQRHAASPLLNPLRTYR